MIKFRERVEAIRIDVDEPRPLPYGRMRPGNDERRARHLTVHLQARADALHKRRLSRTKTTRKDDEVTGPQHARELFAKRPHVIAARDDIPRQPGHTIPLVRPIPKRHTTS